GEKHEFVLGEGGRAELFLCDRTRVCARGTEGGTGFAFFTKLTDREGSVIRIRSGEMTIQLGANPSQISLPFAEAVVAGPGTEVKIMLEGGQATFSRGGGETGDLTVYSGGKAEAIKPGAWTTLTAAGLGKGAKDGKPPEPGEAASKIETFHYVTGKKGHGELALPGGSHLNAGHESDMMLSANRSGVGPHFFAQMRDGNFAVRVKEETGLLLESRRLRYGFAAEGETPGGAGEMVVPPGEKGAAEEGESTPGETPPKEGESEEEPSWDESSRKSRQTAEGLVSIREEDAGAPAGEPGVRVENKGSIETITNDTNRVLVLTVLDPRWEGMVVHVPPGAQVTVMVDADGNIMVHNLSSEIPVQVTTSKKGAKPVQVAPGEMISGDPEKPDLLERVPPEMIDKIYETITQPEEVPTPSPELEPEPVPAPPPVDSFVNNAPPATPPGTVTPPEGEAFDDPGFVDELEEASPYRP
ncbi:MAG: hypothetical protein ACYS47_10020, partial [Planctomycetota bacterium]